MTSDRTEITRAILKRRTISEGLFPSSEEVERRLSRPEALVIYAGYDPTGPSLHIGNSVSLLLLKALARDLGHSVIILFGDFTARIGDPTGKEAARKVMTEEEIEENIQTWDRQIAKLFGDVPYTIKRNNEWLGVMSFADIIKLSAKVTVQQMLARDMFQERIKHERPIYLNEFLYPLAQGYDSVALRVDGEVGGSDQIFNMLVGREFSKELLGKEKLVLATPLLVDPRTNKKMSKSEGDLIALADSPQEIRRKVLDVDDRMIHSMFELCTEKEQGSQDPREAKEELAAELVRMYHGESAVQKANQAIEISITGPLDNVLKQSGVANSMTEAKTLISQGATGVNGETQTDWDYEVKKGDEIRVGKGKFLKIV